MGKVGFTFLNYFSSILTFPPPEMLIYFLKMAFFVKNQDHVPSLVLLSHDIVIFMKPSLEVKSKFWLEKMQARSKNVEFKCH